MNNTIYNNNYVKGIVRRYNVVSVLFAIGIAIAAFGIHHWGKALAFAERGYEAVGGEIFLVPVFLIAMIIVHDRLIYKPFLKRYDKVTEELARFMRTTCETGSCIFECHGKHVVCHLFVKRGTENQFLRYYKLKDEHATIKNIMALEKP